METWLMCCLVLAAAILHGHPCTATKQTYIVQMNHEQKHEEQHDHLSHLQSLVSSATHEDLIYSYTTVYNGVFYGPGGPYALFAGKDASRALAKMTFEENNLNGDLTGLDVFELEALQDWENKFMRKYVKVGSIKKPELTPEPSTTTDQPAESSVAEATESNTVEPAVHVSKPTEDSPSEVAAGETKEETTVEANKQE